MRLRRAVGIAVALWMSVTAPLSATELSPPAPVPPHLGACGFPTGGFVLPGTDGCLSIGGFVRAEGHWILSTPKLAFAAPAIAPAPGRPDATGALDRASFGTEARLTADMRLPTDLGPLRVFVSLRGHNGVATNRAAR